MILKRFNNVLLVKIWRFSLWVFPRGRVSADKGIFRYVEYGYGAIPYTAKSTKVLKNRIPISAKIVSHGYNYYWFWKFYLVVDITRSPYNGRFK